MGLGQTISNHPDYPGTISQVYSEEAARGLYTQWVRMLTAPDWHALNVSRDAVSS